jgi:hypothetical protein
MTDLQIVQSYPFKFYEQEYQVYLASDRQFYVRLDDICEGMGLNIGGQRRRIQEDDAINDKLCDIPMETPYQQTSRIRQVDCLNLRALPYWLGTIDAKRITDPRIRALIIVYKREFAETAWFVYRAEIVPAELMAEVEKFDTPQELAMVELMGQFRDLKRKLDLLSGKTAEELARVGLTVDKLDERFTALEAKIVPELRINTDQARQISQMIKAVGSAMADTKKYGKSQAYAIAENDFKDQFHVDIYSALSPDRMEDAVQYLSNRWRHLKPGQPVPEIFTSGHQPSLV